MSPNSSPSKINQSTNCKPSTERVADFESRLDSPTWGDFLGTLIYVVVIILLAAAQAIAIRRDRLRIYCHCRVCPGWPDLHTVFHCSRSWSGSSGVGSGFIQYAFYQVIAAAVVFIIGNLILGILNLQPTGTISTVQLLGWFPVLLITFVASIYALLKIPALRNHIFSGTSGGSSAEILERLSSMNNDASFLDAKRLYLEQYGDPMVTNTYLKIALALLSIVALPWHWWI